MQYTMVVICFFSVISSTSIISGDSCADCPCVKRMQELAENAKELTENVNSSISTTHRRLKVMWDKIHYKARYSDIYATTALTWFAREAEIIQPLTVHMSSFGATWLRVLQKTSLGSYAVPFFAATGSGICSVATYVVPVAGSIALTTLAGKLIYDFIYAKKYNKSTAVESLVGTNLGAFIGSCGRVAMAATVFGYVGMLAQK